MEDRYTESELAQLLINPELHKLLAKDIPGQYTLGVSRLDAKDPSSYCIRLRYVSDVSDTGIGTFSLFGREFDVIFEPGLNTIVPQ